MGIKLSMMIFFFLSVCQSSSILKVPGRPDGSVWEHRLGRSSGSHATLPVSVGCGQVLELCTVPQPSGPCPAMGNKEIP